MTLITNKQTVLITGASRGIGLALTLQFAHNGWEVFAGARQAHPPLLSSLADELSNVHLIQLDVNSNSDARRALESICCQTDHLDLLINNAAIFPGEGNETLEKLDLDWFAEAFETNVIGVARMTRTFLPLLERSNQPRVINISSHAGSIADKEDSNYYPYAVSKAALNMLTRAMAAEYRPQRILVTAFHPGWVKTDMGGPQAPLAPQKAAEDLYEAIVDLSFAHSGEFLTADGKSCSW